MQSIRQTLTEQFQVVLLVPPLMAVLQAPVLALMLLPALQSSTTAAVTPLLTLNCKKVSPLWRPNQGNC